MRAGQAEWRPLQWNSRSSTVTLLYRGLMRHAVLDYSSKAIFGGGQAGVSVAQEVYVLHVLPYVCMCVGLGICSRWSLLYHRRPS